MGKDRSDRTHNERIRFRELIHLIEDNLVVAVGLGQSIGIGPQIMEKFANGQWHWLEEIADGLAALAVVD